MLMSTQAISAIVNQPQLGARNGLKHFGRNLLHRKETKAQGVDVEALLEVVQEEEAGKFLEKTVLISSCPVHIGCIISFVYCSSK